MAKTERDFVHPYMPNSVPAIKREMLDYLGVDSVEEIYRSIIPDDLIFRDRLDIPEPILSEHELRKHMDGLLGRNVTTDEYSSFLGAGCYKRQIPAVCDEISQRGEFLTGYCGDTYSDHGKMQAIFEYASMLGELLDTDVVSYACYDVCQALSSAMRMTLRIKAKEGSDARAILVPSTMDPEMFSQASEYCGASADIIRVGAAANGRMDLADLENKLKEYKTAAVFYENPSYLGFFEEGARDIANLAHKYGAFVIARPEVSSLGLVESPINMGADLLCGDIQPLGIHMQYGGGQAGFIAGRQEMRFMEQYPTYMYGIAETAEKDRFGWGRAMNYRCSHISRENANEFFGTESGLWCITAGVYLASMGPQGMRELAETILQKRRFAEKVLGEIPDIKVNPFGGLNFQEFIVNFDGSGKTVGEINKALLEKKIFGGRDLSRDFPQYGQSALYCVSEITSEEEILALRDALAEIAGRC